MAGFYPDVPAPRMALDIDGTVFKKLDGAKTVLSDVSGISAIINDTDSDAYQMAAGDWTTIDVFLVIVFPELRDLTGYFIAITGTGASLTALEYSSDTTDGLDGTWTTANADVAEVTTLSPNYRTGIVSQPLPGIKALRFGCRSSGSNWRTMLIQTLHLYGNIAGGQNPDRLRFWHETLDQEIGPAHFDFGDNSVGTSKAIQFRIKNNSTTQTANTISLAKESASFTDVAAGLEFSTDGINYSSTLNIGSLSPGAVSSVIYLRRTFAAAETTSIPKTGRITAAASTWS